MDENNLAVRRELLKSARQVVVKAGTRLLTSQEAIAELVSGIDVLRRAGKRVLLVTSGAVGMGDCGPLSSRGVRRSWRRYRRWRPSARAD